MLQAVDKYNLWIKENPSGWRLSVVDTVPQVHFIDDNTTIDIWGNYVIVNSPEGSFEKAVLASESNKISELLKDLKQQ